MPNERSLGRVAPSGPLQDADAGERSTDHYDVLTASYPELSCFVFAKRSFLRKACVLISHNKIFESFMLFIILCNSITLSLSSNRQDFDGTPLGKALADVDYFFIAVFTFEMVLKIIAMGFVLKTSTYLRDGWNVLDFVVVVMAYVNFLTPSNLTGIRTLRALRPLRTVNKVTGMKVLVTTMFGSLPMLLDVFMLCAFTFFLFGIIAVQMFAGVLRYRCGSPDFSGAYNMTGYDDHVKLVNVSYVVPDDQAELMCSGPLSSEVVWYMVEGAPTPSVGPGYAGRVCDDGMYCTLYGNPFDGLVSYDNILWAWLTIFQHITMSSWTDVMYMVMDAVNYWVWIFYIGLVIFGAFFMVNLALAVLTMHFSADNLEAAREEEEARRRELQEKLRAAGCCNGGGLGEGPAAGAGAGEDAGGQGGRGPEEGPQGLSLHAFLTALKTHRASQRVDEEDAVAAAGPPAGCGRFRRLFWRLATSKTLEYTTAALIIVNTAIMCINWYGMPYKVEQATDYANYGLTLYFLVELLVRIAGIGVRRFFRDGMNRFDTLVVVVSVVELVCDLVPSVSGVGPLSVLRAFRLLRVFRLARHWRELNAILRGMMQSVHASITLTALMLLFMFIAALVGMQLFGYKFMYCDYVEGASPVCPLGEKVWGQCPNHFYCYLPCTADQYETWIDAPGSFYNGQAFCERFCESEEAEAAAAAAAAGAAVNATAAAVAVDAGGDSDGCEFLAMVGKSQVPRAHFDNVFWALYSVFQVLTGDNWNDVMFDSMKSVSDWAALYYVVVIVLGNYLVFNLFIAILLDNLSSRMEKEGVVGPAAGSSGEAGSSRGGGQSRTATGTGAGSGDEDGGGGGSGGGKRRAAVSGSDAGVDGGEDAHERVASVDARVELAVRPPPSKAKPAVATGEAGGGKLGDGRDEKQFGSLGTSSGTVEIEPDEPGREPAQPPRAASPPPGELQPGSVGPKASGGVPAAASTEPTAVTNGADGSMLSATGPGPVSEAVDAAEARVPAAVAAVAAAAAATAGAEAAAGGGATAAGAGATPQAPPGCFPQLQPPNPQPVAPAPAPPPATSAAPGPQPVRSASLQQQKQLHDSARSRTALIQDSADSYRTPAQPNGYPHPDPHSHTKQQKWQLQSQSQAELLEQAASQARIPRQPSKSLIVAASLQSLGGIVRHAGTSTAPHGDAAAAAAPPVWHSEVEGRSLLLFRPDNRFRRFAADVVFNSYFEGAILLVILASCVCLVLDAPSLDPDSTLAAALRYSDYVFTGIFTIEAALKIVAFGFALTGKHAYIRDGWNILDFAIVLLGYALIIVEAVGSDAAANLQMLRVLRAVRALRPLRALRRFAGLRIVVNALLAVLPAMLNVALVCVFFYIIFAILSVNLFKGKLYSCVDAASGERLDPFYVMPPGKTLTRAWCEAGTVTVSESSYYTRRNITMPQYDISTEWVNLENNFDNVGVATLTLFKAATLSGWTDTTFSGVDATEMDEQPIWNAHPLVILYFVFFIVVCSFFVLNLFIGVTLEKFAELHEKQNAPTVLLTLEQRQWVDTQRLLLRTNAQYRPPVPPTKGPLRFRAVLYDIVTHRAFELAVMVVIVVNIVFMALVHADMGGTWQDLMSYSNLTFTAIFLLEAALKITAFGARGYFRDGWNCFDCFVAVVSAVSVVLDFTDTRNVSFMPVLRVLRVARLFRLFRGAAGMQMLLRTLVTSLPALANVGGVMLILFFIFSVIGVNLFAGVKEGDSLTGHANFNTFPNAMLLLFRMLTGEGWDSIMQDCMITTDCVLVTSNTTLNTTGAVLSPPSSSTANPSAATTLPAGTYLDPDDPLLDLLPDSAVDNQCPFSPVAAVIYFPVFVVLCSFILLQLVIAVLLENLIAADSDAELPVPKPSLDSFVDAWSEVDGDCRGLIPASLLPWVLARTEPPLGVRGGRNEREDAQRRLFECAIPLYEENTVCFMEVLHALAGRICATPLPPPTAEQVYAELSRRVPPNEPHCKYTAAHYCAAESMSSAIRGFLFRYSFRDKLEQPAIERLLSNRQLGPQAPPPRTASASTSTSASADQVPTAGAAAASPAPQEAEDQQQQGSQGQGQGQQPQQKRRHPSPQRVNSDLLIRGERLGDRLQEHVAGSDTAPPVLPSLEPCRLPPIEHPHGMFPPADLGQRPLPPLRAGFDRGGGGAAAAAAGEEGSLGTSSDAQLALHLPLPIRNGRLPPLQLRPSPPGHMREASRLGPRAAAATGTGLTAPLSPSPPTLASSPPGQAPPPAPAAVAADEGGSEPGPGGR